MQGSILRRWETAGGLPERPWAGGGEGGGGRGELKEIFQSAQASLPLLSPTTKTTLSLFFFFTP